MKAIILSAGEGTRMRPLTLTKPKTMLPVAGKPIIQYNIEALRECGIKDILIIVGYKEEIVKNYFKDGSEFGVNIQYATQSKLEGTANAISYTLMVITEVEDPSAFGVVELEGEKIVKIIEKPKPGETDSKLINTGIYIFNKDIFDKIDKTEISPRGEYEITDSLSMQIEDGKTIKGHFTTKKWMDIGKPWELIEINEELLNDIKGEIRGTVEEGVTIHGEVFLDEGSLLRSGVYIKGPVYIGKNCDVGPNSYIRGNTYFGDNVHVGNAVEIKNSIIMENTNVSHLSYVGDSILGSNCNIAAGTNIANLRFDNKNVKTTIKNKKIDSGRRKLGAIVGDSVKTGINSSLSPGVKIGVRSTIGSGVLLYDDLESDMRVLVKQEHIIQNKKIKENQSSLDDVHSDNNK